MMKGYIGTSVLQGKNNPDSQNLSFWSKKYVTEWSAKNLACGILRY
jgi:hypothetical protein